MSPSLPRALANSEHNHVSTAKAAQTYKPRALTAAEYLVVDKLVDLILPADETSPGARAAGVARYIDIVLLYGDKATLASWQNGVKQVDAAAKAAHERLFHEITSATTDWHRDADGCERGKPNYGAGDILRRCKATRNRSLLSIVGGKTESWL